jgi:GT2 family glycosyltransferase
MPQISAVIPNYNGRMLLAKHLMSVFRCLRDKDQLLIVDDASSDSSVNWLINFYRLHKVKRVPEKIIPHNKQAYEVWEGDYHFSCSKQIFLSLIVNQENLRFGAAANRGVELATGSLILLLNSDVSPHENILEYLLPYFEKQSPKSRSAPESAVFAVACLEIERHQGRIVMGGKNTITFQRGMFIHARANKFTSGKTAWVAGGSGLFDRIKWLEVGGFDSRYYPAYWEDVDLSWQAQKRGWQVLFEAKAIVDHNHESTNLDAFGVQQMQAMSWRNANKFVRKNANFKQQILHLLWQPYWIWKTAKGFTAEEVRI